MKICFIIPFFNEQPSLQELYERTRRVVTQLGHDYVFIFVDDGSTDGSWSIIETLNRHDPKIQGISFRRNFGKSAALAAGFEQAQGDIIITMDADLQDQPEEIPKFLEKIQSGYDLVSGWKETRHDPWVRVIASRVFNWLSATLTRLPLHDINCGFKAYRPEVVRELSVYGEMHRFLPVLARRNGFTVGEVAVAHTMRKYGKSKFGAMRYLRGFIDLITVVFLTRYIERPAHFFGAWGIVSFLGGLGISLYLTILWFMGVRPIGNRPLFFLGILLIIVSFQLISLGLLGEVLVSKNPKTSFRIKKKL